MKPFLLFLLMSCMVFSACKKDATPSNMYNVTGVKDMNIILQSSSLIQNSIQITHVDGAGREPIHISLTGLPNGIGDTVINNDNYPTFTAVIQFRYSYLDYIADPGVYPVKLVCEGATSGTKTYDFNLTVSSCVSGLLGAYTISDQCNSGSYYTDTAYAAPGLANTIMMNNFDHTGKTAYLTINCSSGSINMAQQTLNGNTYSGDGNFYNSSSKTIYLSISKYTPGSGYTNCNMNMTGVN